MSDQVNARPEDVRKLARALEQFAPKVQQTTKEARKAIDAAHWHDKRKDEFKARFADFERKTNRVVENDIREMTKYLHGLAAKLEQVQSHRM